MLRYNSRILQIFKLGIFLLKILTIKGKKRDCLPKKSLFCLFLALFVQNFQKYCLNKKCEKKPFLEKCLTTIFKQF